MFYVDETQVETVSQAPSPVVVGRSVCSPVGNAMPTVCTLGPRAAAKAANDFGVQEAVDMSSVVNENDLLENFDNQHLSYQQQQSAIHESRSALRSILANLLTFVLTMMQLLVQIQQLTTPIQPLIVL